MQSRKSHAPKTTHERQVYMKRLSPNGTNDQADFSSSGTSTAALSAQPLVKSGGSRPRAFSLDKWWQKWKSEALISLVTAVLMSIGGCIYTLNREVGESSRDILSLEKRIDKVENINFGLISFKVDELWGKHTEKGKKSR